MILFLLAWKIKKRLIYSAVVIGRKGQDTPLLSTCYSRVLVIMSYPASWILSVLYYALESRDSRRMPYGQSLDEGVCRVWRGARTNDLSCLLLWRLATRSGAAHSSAVGGCGECSGRECLACI